MRTPKELTAEDTPIPSRILVSGLISDFLLLPAGISENPRPAFGCYCWLVFRLLPRVI